ncbi:MAG: type II toxin-antitoxin system ParD family antitoxin [Caulobacterales bacterium]|jgi:antitoxin ParD1/3/4
MPTRNVVLTDRHEAMIETLVASGRYQNASEVLREGLRLVEQKEAEEAAKLDALREAARMGMAAIERGDARRFDDMDALASHLDGLTARAIKAADLG